MTAHLLNGDAQQIAQQAMGEVSAPSSPSGPTGWVGAIQGLATWATFFKVAGGMAVSGTIFLVTLDPRMTTIEKGQARLERSVDKMDDKINQLVGLALQSRAPAPITGSLPIVAPPEAEKASKPDVKVHRVRTKDIKPAAPSPWAWLNQGKSP